MKEPLESVTGAGHRLGDFIRDQRRHSQISLRQLATLAGVSNPYLSQIERGLRRPSAEILQQIAKGLRISAEALYLQAGILEQREGPRAVVDALLSDEALSERQKQVLLEIYESFRRENTALAAAGTALAELTVEPEPPAGPVPTTGPGPATTPDPAATRPRRARPATKQTPPTATVQEDTP